jgi:hypothetical protein
VIETGAVYAIRSECQRRKKSFEETPISDGPRNWEQPKAVLLSVDELEDKEISKYCFLLSKLGLIEAVTFRSASGDFVYPICLTLAGKDFLTEAERSLWVNLRLAAIDVVKIVSGIDLNHPVFKALSSAFEVYIQKRGTKS